MKVEKYIALLGFLLVSCTSTIELEQEEYEEQVVVDGAIESGDFANVFLTLSSPFLTNYDSASIAATFLKYGKVTLTCSNGDSEVLTVFKKSALFPPFVYRSVRMKGITGCTYDLKVEVRGKVITASTTIPESPVVKGVRMEAVSDTSGYLRLCVQPSLTEETRLYVQVWSFLADKSYHPAKMPVFLIPSSADPTEVYVYRSNETNLSLLNMDSPFYQHYIRYQYSLTDTVVVKAASMDEQSYQVMKSLFTDLSIQINPFAFNTAGIQSNIIGGIGRWTGLGVTPAVLYVGN
jgi:hypothetical protein